MLISGGSRGLGQALCDNLSKEGAKIAFNYSSDVQGAQKTRDIITENNSECNFFKASVLDEEAIKKMVNEILNKWGRIDILINNAGVSQPLPIALIDQEDWDNVLDVNIKGYYLLTRAVLPSMIRLKSGVILNIGSIAGLRPIASPVHYSASKAAVKGFTEALCKEIGRYNIRINCLAPGLLESGVGQNLPEYRIQQYLEHVSLGRLGTTYEVAKFATFLVSDRNSYMNGTTIIMDGGL